MTETKFSELLGRVAVVMEVPDLAKNLQLLWVDAGYSGENFARVIQQLCGARVEVVKRHRQEF